MIIDAHQHFFEVGAPRAKGPEDYKQLALPEGIVGTILLGDQEYSLKLAADEPLVLGVVGHVHSKSGFNMGQDMPEGGSFKEQVEKWAGNPLFRGIRQTGKDFEAVPKDDGAFLDDMQFLASKDLVLDVFRIVEGGFGGPASFAGYTGSPRALEVLEKIAQCVPKLRILVCHIAHCPINEKPMPKFWQDKFRRMAAHPNIYVKVSGLMERALWRSPDGGYPNERAPQMPGYYRPTLDALWEIFGEDRLMYGSDWPVCEHAGDYVGDGLEIVRPYFAEKGREAYDKFFWKNAMKVYKCKPRSASQR